MDTFLSLAKERFSVRSYLNKPIEENILNQILEAGRVAPSAANFQPWQFFVIHTKNGMDKLSEVYPREWFRNAPAAIILCGDHNAGWKRNDGKDHTDIDIAIAADHMTLAAADLGLGTCWICNFNAKKCHEILELPEQFEPIVILSLGYSDKTSDPDRHNSARKPFREIVRFLNF